MLGNGNDIRARNLSDSDLLFVGGVEINMIRTCAKFALGRNFGSVKKIGLTDTGSHAEFQVLGLFDDFCGGVALKVGMRHWTQANVVQRHTGWKGVVLCGDIPLSASIDGLSLDVHKNIGIDDFFLKRRIWTFLHKRSFGQMPDSNLSAPPLAGRAGPINVRLTYLVVGDHQLVTTFLEPA